MGQEIIGFTCEVPPLYPAKVGVASQLLLSTNGCQIKLLSSCSTANFEIINNGWQLLDAFTWRIRDLHSLYPNLNQRRNSNFAGVLAPCPCELRLVCLPDSTLFYSCEAMADIGIGCAGNVLAKCFCSLWNKVLEKVKMVYLLPRAVTQMKKDVDLGNEIDDIKTELDQAQQCPKRTVKAWLEKAEALKERSETIGHDYETYQQHKNCIGCCPKCLRRYRISKDIRDWSRNVSELQSQRTQPDFPRSGQYGDPTPRSHIPIQIPESGFVPNAKRSEQTALAERLLTDGSSKVQRIGIIGMGGVGKTSMLETINNSEKVKTSFERIIKVTVSQNRHISDMPDLLAQKLNLTQFPDKSNPEERKYMLQSYLKSRKYLFLLDDMWAVDAWTRDELQELGVCLNDTGSKFVLTTRDEEVCARMNVQEKIVVEPLLDEEGWELFRRKAFVNQNGNVPYDIIEPVARRIAEECKGLPLAITVVGAAMAHHTEPHQWQAALEQMQNVPETFDGLYPTVDKQLFQRLRWSYNVLLEDLQICFLSLAAYPEDAEINCEELIDMWIAESVVKDSGDIYLHDIGHSILEHLRNRCLIEVVRKDDVGRIERVKIHDILRHLAVRIGKEKEPSYYFKAGQGMINFPLEEDISKGKGKGKGKGCAKLSLMYTNLQSLPTTFPCQSLSVLLLNGNRSIEKVPQSFLNELPSLRVLDLSSTGITSLPDSIGNLKHLASLQLQDTQICELPKAIGDLKELQFLNLTICLKLRCLPKRIRELKRLRALDISDCIRLNHLPRGISKLVSLERLTMESSGIELEFEKEGDGERDHVCLKDLQTLTRLKVFQVYLKSPVSEGVMGEWSKMRYLSLHFPDVGQRHLPQDMQEMKDLEALSLWNCDVERLPSWVTQFGKLQYLSLWHCNQLIELPTDLPYLRKLTIWYCNNLECVGPVGTAGEGASPLPPMLKSVEVSRCLKLKRLRGRWDQLTHLECIKGSREWWDAIQWDDPNIKTLLQNKCVFHEL